VTAQDDVIVIYQTARIDGPDVSMLSAEFPKEVRRLPHKNMAAELLKKLLSEAI
jgi:type I restriction enzyme R subunit